MSEGAVEAGGVPAEGGEQSQNGGGGLYQEALSGVPEDLRPFVEDHFKKWDSQVTPKLQEAAKLREQFGPLSEIEGLTDVPGDELTGFVGFRNMLAEADMTFPEWLGQVEEALNSPGELDQESWLALGEENGWFDGGEDADADPSDLRRHFEEFEQRLDQKLDERLNERLDPVQKFMGGLERTQAAEKVKSEIESTMSGLEEKHGVTYKSEEDKDERRDVVYQLAKSQEGDTAEAITAAFEQYLKITGQAAGEAVDGKLDQPNGSLSGGRPSTDAPHTSWAEGNGNVNPRDIALARMKQSA